MTAVAQETFNDAIFFAVGMRTFSSASARILGDTPFSSSPTTSAIGRVYCALK